MWRLQLPSDPFMPSKDEFNEKMLSILKQYTDDQIAILEHHLEQRVDLKFDALKESTTIAKDAMEIRLEAMNRFRDDLREQAKTLYSRAEHDLYAEKINESLKIHQSFIDQLKGKADQSTVMFALLFSAIATIIAIIDFLQHLLQG